MRRVAAGCLRMTRSQWTMPFLLSVGTVIMHRDLLKSFRYALLLAALPCSALFAQEPGADETPATTGEESPAVVVETSSGELVDSPDSESTSDEGQADVSEQAESPAVVESETPIPAVEQAVSESEITQVPEEKAAGVEPADAEPIAETEEDPVGIDLFAEEKPTPEAVPEPVELPALTLRQWTTLGARGTLRGSLSVLGKESAAVALRGARLQLLRDGAVVSKATSSTEGEFEFTNVVPGVYTLVATDRECFAVLPITAVAQEGDQIAMPLSVIAVQGLSASRRQSMLAAMTPPSSEELASDDVPADFVATERSVMGTHRVAMTTDGGFVGNVFMPGQPAGSVDMSSMMVRVLRDGKAIGEARVGRSGNFKVYGLAEGPVGIVVFGAQGFAATGIELVSGNSLGQFERTDESFVTTQEGADTGLNVEVAPSGELAPLSEETAKDESEIGEGSIPLEIPQAGGSIAGGVPSNGFASGGGGGGGGGFGGVEGLAALGAIAAAIAASDDNNGQFVPVVVSPAVP